MSLRTKAKAVGLALGVLSSGLAFAAGPATIAHAQDHSCPQDNGVRQGLGNSVPIQWHQYGNTTNWGTNYTVGDLYLGWIPSCHQVYAEIHWRGNANNLFSGTVYLADEHHNSTGRRTFTAGSNAFTDSGFVSIYVPEYDAGSTYADPKSFQAAVELNGKMSGETCSTIVTGNTHSFSNGANTNGGNGASCGFYVPFI